LNGKLCSVGLNNLPDLAAHFVAWFTPHDHGLNQTDISNPLPARAGRGILFVWAAIFSFVEFGPKGRRHFEFVFPMHKA